MAARKTKKKSAAGVRTSLMKKATTRKKASTKTMNKTMSSRGITPLTSAALKKKASAKAKVVSAKAKVASANAAKKKTSDAVSKAVKKAEAKARKRLMQTIEFSIHG